MANGQYGNQSSEIKRDLIQNGDSFGNFLFSSTVYWAFVHDLIKLKQQKDRFVNKAQRKKSNSHCHYSNLSHEYSI